MRGDRTQEVARLKHQFRAADQLTLVVATIAHGAPSSRRGWDKLETRDRMVAAGAVGSALRLASAWTDCQPDDVTTKLGLYVVVDAVAALELSEVLPELAVDLGGPWRCAIKTREHLRTLGPEAEQVAQRIAPSWRMDLCELVFAVRAVTDPGDGGHGANPGADS